MSNQGQNDPIGGTGAWRQVHLTPGTDETNAFREQAKIGAFKHLNMATASATVDQFAPDLNLLVHM